MPNVNILRPLFTTTNAIQLAHDHYNLHVTARTLPSERDQNFHLTTIDSRQFILKISGLTESLEALTLENDIMSHLNFKSPISNLIPRVITAVSNQAITHASANGNRYPVRLITYLPGTLLAQAKPHSPALLQNLGQTLGQMDRVLANFEHPAAQRTLKWDLKKAGFITDYTKFIPDADQRKLVEKQLKQFLAHTQPKLDGLRQSVIHNDANDYNILTDGQQISGIVDFGDALNSATVCELAIAAAYVSLGKSAPLDTIAHVVNGYHTAYPLTGEEVSLLFSLIAMRLCVSVTMAAYQFTQEPENEYLQITTVPAWEALAKLSQISSTLAEATLRHACGWEPMAKLGTTSSWLREGKNEEIFSLRQKHLGKSLSLSYKRPLHIVRGRGAYLYDENGQPFLDAVNNVAHVGHCHPKVVEAAQRQTAVLNTNSRYLHSNIVALAARLTATLPEQLSVCFFVCSGSEANELALRLARTHTGQQDLLVLDGAYHGNTAALIDISPYKFNGPGGAGAPAHVHILPMPDSYRNRGNDGGNGRFYAQHAQETIDALQKSGKQIAGFIGESLLGCGGQIVLPDGYFQALYAHIRTAGGVCIADEVQVGFGRVGSQMWGFQTQEVVPDIVTLGKPMGNGHPIAAVVTTPQIADSFANGMEYFNTFGGNPVSCAVGLAVLDVLEQENLQENAHVVGNHLMAGLRGLQEKHPLIGDVRGLGLFVGVELVQNRQTLEPAAAEATHIVNQMRDKGILISSDGPLHNVLKIKPPLVFSKENADFLVGSLGEILKEMANRLVP
ncbi:MAG: aminotransferase class III-fold pyridoxal phosphate-dependent enzyme [Chloroflexi bacterium]|nr:aminotransferase class III-fold pyridoxal phosphate-dependent enzyme [Chloroflexota bacterium]